MEILRGSEMRGATVSLRYKVGLFKKPRSDEVRFQNRERCTIDLHDRLKIAAPTERAAGCGFFYIRGRQIFKLHDALRAGFERGIYVLWRCGGDDQRRRLRIGGKAWRKQGKPWLLGRKGWSIWASLDIVRDGQVLAPKLADCRNE